MLEHKKQRLEEKLKRYEAAGELIASNAINRVKAFIEQVDQAIGVFPEQRKAATVKINSDKNKS